MTLISVCSLGGIFVVPFMNKSFFCTMLMFLIALGVGALAANGLICLIPEVGEVNDIIVTCDHYTGSDGKMGIEQKSK